METRILREVEEMINKVRAEQGRPFDVKLLTMTCVANIIMNMMFGLRFDHTDPAFQRLMSDSNKFLALFPVQTEMFPALRFIPPFKKNLAEYVATTKRIVSCVDNIISACIEVSYFIYWVNSI